MAIVARVYSSWTAIHLRRRLPRRWSYLCLCLCVSLSVSVCLWLCPCPKRTRSSADGRATNTKYRTWIGWQERRCWANCSSKIFNLCGHDPPTSQTDRQTDDMRSQDRAFHYSASRGKSKRVELVAYVIIIATNNLESPSTALGLQLQFANFCLWMVTGRYWPLVN